MNRERRAWAVPVIWTGLILVGLQLTGCMEEEVAEAEAEAGTDTETGTNPETGTNTDAVTEPALAFANAPRASATVGDTYVYQAEITGSDADAVSFRIENRPYWLNWDRTIGRLAGTPGEADTGPWTGLRILASDGGEEVSAGPFTITVEPGATDAPTPETAETVSHPGHYISMNRYDDAAAMIEAIKPGVAGIQKRYFWAELEPTYGNYDFSAIRADLELLAAQGLRLVVFIEDKSFNGDLPAPPYLQNDHTLVNRNGGFTTKRWAPYVVDRFASLLQVLGAEIGDHVAFEGIALQESALSLTDDVLDAHGYSPERYRDALIDIIRSSRLAFPRSQVFWYMNFLPRGQDYIADIANVAAKLDVAMGGPDVLPDNDALRRHSYPFYSDFHDRMTLFNSVQYDSYAHLHRSSGYATRYWTMDELFQYARDELHVSYIFWTRKVRPNPFDSYTWQHALTTISANPIINNN